MKISKKRSRLIAFGALALFLVLGFGLLNQNRKQSVALISNSITEPDEVSDPEDTISEPEATSPGDSAFVLNNFHRVESKNGKTVWEVKAKRGQYFTDSSSARVEDAQLWIFREPDGVVQLKAGEARLYMKGVSLDRAEAYRGVELTLNEGLTAQSKTAEFSRTTNKVFAPGFVTIRNERMTITGTTLRADLNSEEFYFESDVSTEIKAEKES